MGKRRIPVPHWASPEEHSHNPFRDVPISTLENYSRELTLIICANERQNVRLKAIRSMVTEAFQSKDGPDAMVLSDHAIVRYLERYEGLDVERIEKVISEMFDDGRPEIAFRDGVVITLLPEGRTALDTDSLPKKERGSEPATN